MSPCDRIFTHFPVEEKMVKDAGRLGEECQRISEIIQNVTDKSLIIMNETFSSTSGKEGEELGKTIIHAFKLIGCSVIYATHYYQLASLPEVVSMTADTCHLGGNDIGQVKYTYRIKRRKPDGNSYAKEVAKNYGLNFTQQKSSIYL